MSDNSPASTFRQVPRTGVIFVMTEAARRGYFYGNADWANLGQGAPETGDLETGPPRVRTIELTDEDHEYAPVPGLWELREAVANLYNQRYRKGMKSQYTAENVAIGAGGRLSLSRLAAALGRMHVGHFLPDYTAYEELLDQFERFIPIPTPLDPERGYVFSANELESEIIARGLSAILLSNPCNPTGKLIAGSQLKQWVDVGRRLDSYLIFDEFYANYIWDPVAAGQSNGSVSAAAYVEDVETDPVIILDGLTKNWRYPGWRVGWTLAPRHVIDRLSSVGSFLDGGASHPMQKAAVELVQLEYADAEAASIRRAFAPKREMMLKRLVQMGVRIDVSPSGAFYVWGDVSALPEGMNNGMDFYRRALDYQVIVVPGQFFDVNPGKRRSGIASRFENYVRFSFGPDMATIEGGLSRLEQMIREAQSSAS